jgi:hypothetical protein
MAGSSRRVTLINTKTCHVAYIRLFKDPENCVSLSLNEFIFIKNICIPTVRALAMHLGGTWAF